MHTLGYKKTLGEGKTRHVFEGDKTAKRGKSEPNIETQKNAHTTRFSHSIRSPRQPRSPWN